MKYAHWHSDSTLPHPPQTRRPLDRPDSVGERISHPHGRSHANGFKNGSKRGETLPEEAILGMGLVRTFHRFPLLVHSHLSWDWVWQRPQQFLSRLAARHHTMFVETHSAPAGRQPYCDYGLANEAKNVMQVRVMIPEDRWPDGDYVDLARCQLIQRLLARPEFAEYRGAVQWFYDVMAAPSFIGHSGEVLNVFDCMDQLSQFKGAPQSLAEREALLLREADLVFCGGRKLWENKRPHNQNCFFYGCGVDCDHFAKAMHSKTSIAAELQDMKGPIFGYIGVVDERLDYDLIAQLADATEGSVVIVGPATKVDPSTFPQRDNLHWLGGRPYAELPSYAKGFDVCLMPFALNEATEFINPTKTLEYLATGTPVVSTPVPDVVALFDREVMVAPAGSEFVDACRKAAAEPDPDRQTLGLARAADNTWDKIVERLEDHVLGALCRKFDRTMSAASVAASAAQPIR